MRLGSVSILWVAPLAVLLLLAACAKTSITTLDNGINYAPTSNVSVLSQPPAVAYKEIAILETRGAPNMSFPELIESMREEAMAAGADAIVLIGSDNQVNPGVLMFNPLLGGYQTIPGSVSPILRGVAIKYQ